MIENDEASNNNDNTYNALERGQAITTVDGVNSSSVNDLETLINNSGKEIYMTIMRKISKWSL